jgi:uncharacterized membrane protein YcaP (DUF421 family)
MTIKKYGTVFARLSVNNFTMEWIKTIFGEGTDLNCLQMSSRAILAFFITLLLIRIAGVRTFGKKSPFDNVIIILLGSVLSRAVVGASPFIPTTVACLAFVLVHWLLAWLSLYNETIGRWVKGEKTSLYAGGRENKDNMRRSRISHKDLLEDLRLRINADNFDEVEEIFIERNGEISVVKKK